MKFFDYIRFALKNIWRQKLRTILTIFAIIIGATSVVVMLSLVFGAKQAILGQIEASGALTQITVTPSTDTSNQDVFGGGNSGDHSGKKLDDAFANQLAAMPHVYSVSPLLSVWVFSKIRLQTGPVTQYNFSNVQAYVPGSATDKQLSAGRNLTATDDSGKIVLGSKYLDRLGYKDNPQGLVGKKVILTTQKGFSGEGAIIPSPPAQGNQGGQQDDSNYRESLQNQTTEIEAEVIGVTVPGPFEDASFISLSWARKLLTFRQWQQDPEAMKQQNQAQAGQPFRPSQAPPMKLMGQDPIEQNGYDQLILKIDGATNVELVAVEIRKLGVGAITAKDTLITILNAFKVISWVLGAVGAISLFVAAIGVINTMVMATLERTREIGVMRACGATRSAVRWLFTFEAALLGFWGGVFGVLAGVGLGKIANKVAAAQLTTLGGTALIKVPWWLALSVIGATTLIGILAGLYPAFRASRLDPVEALRYE